MSEHGAPLGVTEVPDYARTSSQAFLDWYVYSAPWPTQVPPLILDTCPLCAALLAPDWRNRLSHGWFHAALLFPAPADPSQPGSGQ